jgi:SNF2 family DNA or RNA helicase
VDPLPHQLEAVYDYLLKLARVRFLLADDAGAGKTIMAGLLLRELRLRGLVQRVLIVCPANLAFQWQRELRESASHLVVEVRRAPQNAIEPDFYRVVRESAAVNRALPARIEHSARKRRVGWLMYSRALSRKRRG